MSGWMRADATALAAVFLGAALGGLLFPTDVPTGSDVLPAAPVSASPTDPVQDPADGPLSDPVAFHASSFGLGWGLEGDYAGALSRVGEELRVDLSLATVRAMYVTEDWSDEPQHVVGIRLALAEDGPGGWRAVREGPLVRVDRAVSPGSRLGLEGIALTLPDLPEEELFGRWLVIVHELAVPAPDGSSGRAWSYAHAEPDLLPRLMGWVEDGC